MKIKDIFFYKDAFERIDRTIASMKGMVEESIEEANECNNKKTFFS